MCSFCNKLAGGLITRAVAELPDDENEFIADMMSRVDENKYNPDEYELKSLVTA
jgi:hypothetical protein